MVYLLTDISAGKIITVKLLYKVFLTASTLPQCTCIVESLILCRISLHGKILLLFPLLSFAQPVTDSNLVCIVTSNFLPYRNLQWLPCILITKSGEQSVQDPPSTLSMYCKSPLTVERSALGKKE